MNKKPSVSSALITVGRIFQTGLKNLFRNAWLSIAAIAVMVVALTIILSAIVVNVTARNAIKELSKSLKVSVYLHEDVSDERRNALEQALNNNPHSVGLDYISKDAAKERFRDSFRNDEDLLEGLALAGQDTLPASYEVSVEDLSKMPEIEAIAAAEEYSDVVEGVSLGKTESRRTIDRAASTQKFMTTASIISASIFTVVSILIIFNTIRMAIFTRSEEIRIMKLIGATPNYIRGPFLVEASFYGVIAGLVAAGATYSVILFGGSKIGAQTEFADTYIFFVDPIVVFAMFFGAILSGVLIGIFSSALAMEKHLKLKNW